MVVNIKHMCVCFVGGEKNRFVAGGEILLLFFCFPFRHILFIYPFELKKKVKQERAVLRLLNTSFFPIPL